MRRIVGLLAGLVVAAALAIPPSANAQPREDGLKVTLCGTSGPLPVRDRAKPCVAVEVGDALYLVDIGPEATENLVTWRMGLGRAKAVFLTHLHSDHIGDLGEFNMQSWVAGRPAPLALVGPPGVERVAAGFNQAYDLDRGYRQAHHEHGDVKLPVAAGELKAKVVAPPASGPAVAWRDGDLTVTAILVAHEPASPAYAYRFDYKGRSVVISGDTRKWEPLAQAAKGADLLIHEAQDNNMTRMMAQGLTAAGQPRMASIMADTTSYHTSPIEAADIARTAGVRALVLTHLTQAGLPFFTPEGFTRGMDDGGKLDWRLAADGMTIDLPAGGDDIRFSQR